MIRKFGGTTGVDNQPTGLDLGIGGSNIKSKQSGQYIISSSSATTFVIDISNVNINNSVIIINVYSTMGGTSAYSSAIRASFINSTTIRFTRESNNLSPTITIDWEVVEFNNVKSRQTGLVLVSTTPQNITISQVDINKILLFVSFSSQYATTYLPCINYRLTTSTNLCIENGQSENVQWQVIEFN